MYLITVTISFLVTFSILPVIIKVFKSINILDEPDRRKIHKYSTPSLGGIAIFGGILFSILVTLPLSTLVGEKYFLAGLFLMYFMGMRDDISSLNANYKLLFQSLTAFLVVSYSGLRLEGFHGVLGLGEVSEFAGVMLTMFIIIGLTNAFNLIDGIDGLAGGIALTSSLIFGIWFYLVSDSFYSTLSFAVTGASVAFLFFNWQPSKIFMGDTGSIFLGYLLCCLAIQFININSTLPDSSIFRLDSYVGFAFAVLIIPIYDTLRVMFIRIYSGKSPFYPDKKHIHHILLKQGYTHAQSSIILLSFNGIIVLITYQMQYFSDSYLIASQLISCILFGLFFDIRLKKQLQSLRSSSKKKELFISKSA